MSAVLSLLDPHAMGDEGRDIQYCKTSWKYKYESSPHGLSLHMKHPIPYPYISDIINTHIFVLKKVRS